MKVRMDQFKGGAQKCYQSSEKGQMFFFFFFFFFKSGPCAPIYYAVLDTTRGLHYWLQSCLH